MKGGKQEGNGERKKNIWHWKAEATTRQNDRRGVKVHERRQVSRWVKQKQASARKGNRQVR